MERSTLVRVAIFLATVVAAWAVLSIGSHSDLPQLEEGRPSPQTFFADQAATVVDRAETERLQQEARAGVPEPREVDTDIQDTVINDIQAVFEDLQSLVIAEPPASGPEIPELPELSEETTTTSGDDTQVPEPSDPAVLTGLVFIDVDGDGVFDPETEDGRADRGVMGVDIEVRTHQETFRAVTNDNGTWEAQYPGGPAVVVVDHEDPDVPDGYSISTENTGQLVECPTGETCETDSVGLQVRLRLIDEVVASMDGHAVPESALVHLAGVAADDVVRAALGEPLHLPAIQSAAVTRATLEFASRIVPEDLGDARTNIRNNPPQVIHSDTGISPEDSAAAGEVVAANLQANYRVNRTLWEQQQEAAANEVEAVEEEFDAGSLIVTEGQRLTQLHIDAIERTSVPTIVEQPSGGLMAVIVVMVSLIGVYLATFRPEFWARPRMVALLGIMIVLAAAAVRGTLALEESFSWYVLPAVAFGFVTAVLFDQRIAILMALAVGVLTALGTLDPGVSVYGTLAALAPIPFVSAVSTRGAFRNAVVLSALVAATVAAATSWFFHVGSNELTTLEVVPISIVWAFGVSVFASMLGLAALQFFESAFDITTTLGLLDLTDRNHEALQMLQEEAFGTFNHSLMVGTLADAAARSIGANALLARAMAYYHDLGKTQSPTFFIENQFGMTNPHDDLDPKESARIVRDHVTAGVGLAREYKIPTEVTEGIVSHHGDGVMRFFYEKARQQHGDDVDIDDFRHIGHKPRTAESAILMLADSLEAACRAVFQTEEPTPDAIEKVVDRIMNEKLEDGQLSESPLTLAEMTKIRRAFLDSLIGHYHQRIAYPNFPGS